MDRHYVSGSSSWRVAATCCAIAASLFVVAVASAQPKLFSEFSQEPVLAMQPPTNADEDIGGLPARRGFRVVDINFGQLDAIREDLEAQSPPEVVLFNLYRDLSFRAIAEGVTRTPRGYALRGRLEDVPFGTWVLVVNGDTVAGRVYAPPGVYTIRNAGRDAFVVEETEMPVLRGNDVLHPSNPPNGRAGGASDRAPSTKADTADRDDGSVIDVFVLWTPEARRRAGGLRRMLAEIDLKVEETNAAYAGGGLDLRINLAGADQTDAQYGDMFAILNRLVVQGDGSMDEAHRLRDLYAADMFHLLVEEAAGANGVAWSIGGGESDADGAFSVSRVDASGSLFAHELGHSLGLAHDRYVDPFGGLYPYSHGYVNQRAFDGDAPEDACWVTIMAYVTQCYEANLPYTKLLRFSNAHQRWPDAAGDPLGVPGDRPSTALDGPADAVRSLDEARRVVANYRASADRCGYRLAESELRVPTTGGVVSVEVTSDRDCPLEVRGHDPFLAVSASRGEARVRVSPNPGGSRVGTVSVAGEVLAVYQAGGESVASVCDRTPAVRDALLALAGRDDCAGVTEFDLGELSILDLSGRGIVALAPGDFDGLSSVRILHLGNNELSGPIHSTIAELRSLEVLDLSDNALSGEIPTWLGGLSALRELRLRGNGLSGPVPAELGRLLNLEGLDLSQNALSGPIPPELTSLLNLEWLDLSGNGLSGPVPAELGRLLNLEWLGLSQNALSGPIPPELTSLLNLFWLDLSGNELSGPIPPILGNLLNLIGLALERNELSGPIPPELGNLLHLELLYLQGNELSGPIPPELGNLLHLRLLYLQDNELSGPIPPELGNLLNLKRLHVEFNNLSGPIPPELGNLLNLKGLHVEFNNLSGPIPPELGNLLNLKGLYLQNNELSGPIPPELGNLTSLQNLAMHDNKLSGPIPPEVSMLPALRSFFASGNGLDGCAPMRLHEMIGTDLDAARLPDCAAILFVTGGEAVVEGGAAEFSIVADIAPAEVIEVSVDVSGDAHFGIEAGKRVVMVPAGALEGRLEIETVADAIDEPDGTVTAAIAATDRYGVYADRASAVVEIADDTGPGAPTITAVRPGDRSLTVEWRGPGSDDIIGYDLRHRATLMDGDWRVVDDAATDGGGYVLDGLANGVARDIQVRAVSAAGDGAWSGTAQGTPRLCLPGITDADCQTLLAVRDGLAGNGSLNWQSDTPPEDWVGVTLHAEGRVKYLILWDAGLDGQIPPALGSLQSLEFLNLGRNGLSGPIPSELGNLVDLDGLILRANQLSGAIPPELGKLASLKNLFLDNNELTGAIPAELGNLAELQNLILYRNDLSGPIPPELGSLVRLEELALFENRLSGPIPPELGHLLNLEGLDLSDNELSGPIPPELGKLTALQRLSLFNNKLSGTIPPELGNLAELRTLYLSSNQLSGPIPPELGNLASLENLNLSNNNLSGPIPPELGNLARLRQLSLDDNRLTGPVPPGLGNLTSLELLTLGRNSLTGCLPPTLDDTIETYTDLSPPESGTVPLFLSDAHTDREAFARVRNHAASDTAIRILAYDDSGSRYGPATLSVRAGATTHFNSGDLAWGNPAKGLESFLPPGFGDWRLEFSSGVDVEVLAYVRTGDGFVTAVHDTAPVVDGQWLVPVFNPASNRDSASRLRIANTGPEEASVTIWGTDDSGMSTGPVRTTVTGQAALSLSASDLEAGAAGLDGAFGDGAGKWRLAVESDQPVSVASLLESTSGHLTNLSAEGLRGSERTVALFPAPSADGQGFVRVINHSDRGGEVIVEAYDDAGDSYSPITLRLGAGEARHFNSDDLELGNAAKGMPGIGSGTGDWRLEFSTDLEAEVLAYFRTPDGYLTVLHPDAPKQDGRQRIALFNPGSNTSQVSRLRLVNPGNSPAVLRIRGTDDAGKSSSGEVRVTLSAGAARTLTAGELETGGDDFEGALGDGRGKWRLTVDADRPVIVLSLLRSPGGHVANLSTVPSHSGAGCRSADASSAVGQ